MNVDLTKLAKLADLKQYFIYAVVAVLLLILTVVMHLIVLKQEQEEKEYLDLKMQKKKVNGYNIVRDILLNILMFLLVVCARIYLGKYTVLVLLPSFLVFCYYNKRRCDTRFSIYLFLVFAIAGIITGSLYQINVSVYDALTLCMILMLCVLYSRMKLIGLFGIAAIAALTGTTDIQKFVLFVMFLVLACIYERVRKISYIAICLFCYCMLNLHNSTYLMGLGIIGVILCFLYFKSTHKVVKKEKKNGIALDLNTDFSDKQLQESKEQESLIHFEEKKDFVKFDIDEIEPEPKEDEFVKFDIDKIE